VFTASLPTHFTPAHIVGQDIDDVRLLAKFLLQRCQLLVDLFVFGRPLTLVLFL
jgi:hypothetical protein